MEGQGGRKMTSVIQETRARLTTPYCIKSMEEEIERYVNLVKTTEEQRAGKIVMCSLIGLIDPEKYKEKIHLIDDYYKKSGLFIDFKIYFYKGFMKNELKPNALEEMNEKMMDWLESAWLYFGQEGIIKDSENAKEEYKMFKAMFACCEKKEEKKKTRRGGKKHKKKL